MSRMRLVVLYGLAGFLLAAPQIARADWVVGDHVATEVPDSGAALSGSAYSYSGGTVAGSGNADTTTNTPGTFTHAGVTVTVTRSFTTMGDFVPYTVTLSLHSAANGSAGGVAGGSAESSASAKKNFPSATTAHRSINVASPAGPGYDSQSMDNSGDPPAWGQFQLVQNTTLEGQFDVDAAANINTEGSVETHSDASVAFQ